MPSFLLLDMHLFVQCILYLTLFVLGFVVSIPLGVTTSDFDGHCILYGDISWKNETFFTYKMSSNINCSLGIYFAVFACIFYGLAMAIYYGYAITRKDPNIGFQMWVMPFILVTALAAIVSFIASCIISVGFKQFCDSLVDRPKVPLSSCRDGSKINWNILGNTSINPSHYFAYLTVTQLASWITFLVWSAQLILLILRFVRNRRLRSKGQLQDTQASPASSGPDDLQKIASVQPTA
ncbi:transmembrane protein 179-like [Gigantopelta aegis]|uniref:transmembrane protein 179-like n=1 Tax=Gigantopelta aegis TaxID=1735272 RepID=UPI001B88CD37|nr:transmembrane protein 179-like [Gigantopelta aegis]